MTQHPETLVFKGADGLWRARAYATPVTGKGRTPLDAIRELLDAEELRHEYAVPRPRRVVFEGPAS